MAEILLLHAIRPLLAGTHIVLTKALSDMVISAVEKEANL